MDPKTPPPVPKRTSRSKNRPNKFVIALAVASALVLILPILLRASGLIRMCRVPTGGMAPAVASGDRVLAEGISLLFREPRRGEVVLFRTDQIDMLPPRQLFMARVAGRPREHLQLKDGKLFVDEKQVLLKNSAGVVVYELPPGADMVPHRLETTVPEGYFYLLGDNSTNSFDSRFYGSVPRGSIVGRVVFCVFPPKRTGRVK